MTKSELEEANKSYYEGNPVMTDAEYDAHLEEYMKANPNDVIMGYKPTRARKLDIPMFSLNKHKTIEDIHKWLKSKLGDVWENTEMILMGKYDGISVCVDESQSPERRKATKRGDGVTGQECDKHYSYMNTGDKGDNVQFISFGEAIMRKSVFRKYDTANGGLYKNARNLVGSQLNMDKPTVSILKDIDYIRYGCTRSIHSKSNTIDILNAYNPIPVQYKVLRAKDITHEIMMSMYTKWSTEYELDGIVVEINSINTTIALGREKNMNPAYAVAYKGHFEDVATTCVEGITWQVSKHGKLKPVIQIESVRLNGVDVTNVTGYNARNIFDKGIGEGAIVSVKRSGAVIPKIVEVHNPCDPEDSMVSKCPSCKTTVFSDGVDLICPNKDCPDMNTAKITAFFHILKCQEVGYGTMEAFYKAGFKSIPEVLDMKPEDMCKIDKYGDRKSAKVHNAIHKCVDGITKADLMHASGCFTDIGGATIQLIMDGNCTSQHDIQEYNVGLVEFNKFYEVVKKHIKLTGSQTVKTNKLAGFNVVFTGFRSVALEKQITENGGKVSNGVSVKTTHLVMAYIGSGTQKELKAEQLGVVIVTGEDFETILNAKLK